MTPPPLWVIVLSAPIWLPFFAIDIMRLSVPHQHEEGAYFVVTFLLRPSDERIY